MEMSGVRCGPLRNRKTERMVSVDRKCKPERHSRHSGETFIRPQQLLRRATREERRWGRRGAAARRKAARVLIGQDEGRIYYRF